jgi:NitT/TauT family transport system permease protein
MKPTRESPFVVLVSIVAPPVVAAVLGFSLWEGAARALSIPGYLLPPPSAVALAAFSNARSLGEACATTALAACAGFVASAVFGVAIALGLASSRVIERGLYPYALVLQTVPIVAIAPLLVLWCGVGTRAVAASAFIVSVFPVITNTLAGVRAVDPALRDLFKLYGASRGPVLFKLELPHSAPQIATGLRIACGLSVIGAIVGEFVAGFSDGSPGLGIVVMTAYRQLRTDLLFAAVGCSALLGVAIFGLVAGVSHLALRRWYTAAR